MPWFTEGLAWALECLFSDEQSVPENFYLLLTTGALVKGDTLADNGVGWTECTGTGYARQAIASSAVGFTSGAHGTAWKVEAAAAVQFAATGDDWDDALWWALATGATNSGVLVCGGPLSELRSLTSGDTLDVTPTVGLDSSWS